MRKRQYMTIIIVFLLIGVLIFGYYYYPRKVNFELVNQVKVAQVDHPIIVVSERKILDKFLKEIFETEQISDITIDYSLLDFNKNDYVISFNKKLLSLKHSPYLSKKYDLCPYLKEKPVIPEFTNDIDESIYIYKIDKKGKYRAICP